jgi:dTDP-4-dehydrorhamnose 3,5-epimerase
MKFIETPLKDAFVIELTPFRDRRGEFARLFCKEELKAIGHSKEILQINHSISRNKGALRGMHYQRPPKTEVKIVRCIRGAVYDVIIDIRRGSESFLKWHGERITEDNLLAMYIPEGFAHGFQTLEPESELLYFHSAFYDPEYEGAIRFDDPKIGIKWPIEISEMSERDRSHPLLPSDFKGISFV